MRLEKGSVHCEIRWRARKRLDIYSPFSRVNIESSQCSLLAQSFALVDIFISSIIPTLKEDVQNSETYTVLILLDILYNREEKIG